jgi:hypothetical protein
LRSLHATAAWVSREMSTFKYLLTLNEVSGRSFSDARFYPVFPWVLSDYASSALDLARADVFRDLAKPMVALGAERLANLKARSLPPDDDGLASYLCSACYSSPLCICLWLLRMEPFTSMHVKAQNGRFDVPSRIFTSVALSYEVSTSMIGDYRELVPEFYFDNQFLMNVNSYDLGQLRGEVLNDAVLPPWCHQSAIEFVYLQRKALESDFVSDAIAAWIDLVWGYRQNGAAAEEADNTFCPFLYENAPADRLEEVEAWRESCGQIPHQLFTERHPARAALADGRLLTKAAPLRTTAADLTLLAVFKTKLLCLSGDEVIALTVSVAKADASAVKQRSWRPRLGGARAIVALSKHEVCAVLDGGALIRAGAGDCAQAAVGIVATLSGRGEYLCVGRGDTSIAIYRELTVVQTFPSFRNEIVCSAVSAAFDLAVVGARESTLFLISLSHGAITRVISLGKCNPVSVLVTPAWGFILVYERDVTSAEEFIELFTVNGDPIRRVRVAFEIECWSAWQSTAGFDYAVIAPKSGRLRVCEAFWLTFQLLPQSANGTRAVFYSPPLEAVFLNQADGQIVMIPYAVGP